jgi:energy-coupling factor transporter ATP-binding protein EcfA2
VRQNLSRLCPNLRRAGSKKKIAELMELLEIGHLSDRVTGQLSAGESTRVNLVKAFLNDPELLMLDEPTASLDPDIADKVRKVVRKVQRERNIGILYTSHNMRDIEEVCDRVIFLHKGKIVCEGTPDRHRRPVQQHQPGGCLHQNRPRWRNHRRTRESSSVMNFNIISALVLRYLFLYTRSPMRLVELVFWPVVDLVVWGNVTVFIQKNTDPNSATFILFFLGGDDPLGHHVSRSAGRGHFVFGGCVDAQSAECLRRSGAHVGIRQRHFIVGTLRIAITAIVLSLISWFGYSFNVFQLELVAHSLLCQSDALRLVTRHDIHGAHPALGAGR